MTIEKLEKMHEIINSKANGQRTQMITQIKTYGVRKFFYEFAQAILDGEIITGYADNLAEIYMNISWSFYFNGI